MKLVTHDGIFHADDVFASAALLAAFPGAALDRTRDPQRVAAADIAFDVGGGAYDHHQRGGNGARPNGIPYAAFGLVWKAYGPEMVAALGRYTSVEMGWLFTVADAVDRLLVQQIDAADNGYALSGPPVIDGVRGVSVSSVIAWLNDEARPEQAFDTALGIADAVLRNVVRQAANQVDGAAAMRAALHRMRDGIAVLDQYVPDWQAQACANPRALYVVYPSAGTWRVQGVPAVYGAPGVRKALPEAWGGLDGAALAALAGVADATFAHRGLFIAGAVSREGALALAQLAVDAQSQPVDEDED